MRYELIKLLSALLEEGYIISFRVTKSKISERLSELRYAAAVLRDMKENTKDGAFVQMGAYWYEVQDLTKSIEAIKEAIEEAENEEAG